MDTGNCSTIERRIEVRSGRKGSRFLSWKLGARKANRKNSIWDKFDKIVGLVKTFENSKDGNNFIVFYTVFKKGQILKMS